jgi:hypothetical protein
MDPNPVVIPLGAKERILRRYPDAILDSLHRFPPGFTLTDYANMNIEKAQAFEAKAMTTYEDGAITQPILVGFLIPIPKKDEKKGGRAGKAYPKKTKKLVRKGRFIHFLYLGPQNGKYIMGSNGVLRRLYK